MKEYSVTMTVSVNVTVSADSRTRAAKEALTTPVQNLSEFYRVVDMVEDITAEEKKPRRGRGSY